MLRRAIVASLALHAGLLIMVGWRSPYAGVGTGPAVADASLVAGDTAGPLFTAPVLFSEPAAELPLAEPEFIPSAPVVVPSPPQISSIGVLPSQFQEVSDIPPEVATPKLNGSASRGEKASHLAPTRSGKKIDRRQASGTAGGGGDLRTADYVPPQFLVRHKPLYPEAARAQRLEGTVLLLVVVDAAGRVTSANVLRSCGHTLLDRAAIAAVRSWRFDPARQDGVAVAARVEVPVRFRFEKRSATRP